MEKLLEYELTPVLSYPNSGGGARRADRIIVSGSCPFCNASGRHAHDVEQSVSFPDGVTP